LAAEAAIKAASKLSKRLPFIFEAEKPANYGPADMQR
jgi:hypothetical protein